MTALPFHNIEYHEASALALPQNSLQIACYNIERGLNIDTIIDHWQRQPASLNDIVLLSEADQGMARSSNRHITRDFATALGYSWAYGVEFLELTKGSRKERRVPGQNQTGYIGNAIVSRYPLSNLQLVRLPCFFDYSQRFMARMGSRIAIVGDLQISGGEVTVVSVHLESDSSPHERLVQMEALLEVVRIRDRGQPIIIAGDMNTTGLDVNRLVRSVLCRPWLVVKSPSIKSLEQIEPLFALLKHEGYDYRHCNKDNYTLSDRGYRAHLDWFFIKNVMPEHIQNPIIYKGFENRKRFSDHLPLSIEISLNKYAKDEDEHRGL